MFFAYVIEAARLWWPAWAFGTVTLLSCVLPAVFGASESEED
jgi:hypothetical protein